MEVHQLGILGAVEAAASAGSGGTSWKLGAEACCGGHLTVGGAACQLKASSAGCPDVFTMNGPRGCQQNMVLGSGDVANPKPANNGLPTLASAFSPTSTLTDPAADIGGAARGRTRS